MVLRPIKSGNTFEQTVERLADAIKLGVVATGERLPPERSLAEQLNVSRVTLREAIKALQQAGFVESRRGRNGGTFVRYHASQRQAADPRATARSMGAGLFDALDFRRVVEPGVAELAATQRLSVAQADALEGAVEAVRRAPEDLRRTCDSHLHLLIAEAAGSPTLAVAIADVQVRLDELLSAIPVLSRNIEHSNDQHGDVVAAILSRKPSWARALMTDHVEATALLLRSFLA